MAPESNIDTNRTTVWTEFDSETMGQSLEAMDADSNQIDSFISEKDIYQVLNQPYSPCEQLFTEAAITIGTEAGVLQDDEYSATYPQAAPLANDKDLQQFQIWELVLCNAPNETTEITSSSKAHDCHRHVGSLIFILSKCT